MLRRIHDDFALEFRDLSRKSCICRSIWKLYWKPDVACLKSRSPLQVEGNGSLYIPFCQLLMAMFATQASDLETVTTHDFETTAVNVSSESHAESRLFYRCVAPRVENH